MTLKELIESEQRRVAAGEPEPAPLLRLSFVARTGQSARLLAAQWTWLLGTAVMFGGWVTLRRSFGMALVLGGTALFLAGFVALCLSVRCPRCRVAVVWHTFNTRSQSAAMLEAFYQLVCPKCGYDPP